MSKIKSITKFVGLVIDHNDEPSEWIKRSYVELDESGNTTEDILYSENGEIESKTCQVYDNQNRIIERISYISENEIGEHFKFTLNEEGKIISETIAYADQSQSFKQYVREGNTITSTIIDEDGDLEGKEIRIFDDNNNLVEETIFDEDEEVEEKCLYQYDDNQNISMKVEYGRNDEFTSRRQIKYNDQNNPVEIISTTEKGEIISHRTIKYDQDENIIEQVIDGFVIKNYYNSDNQHIKEETYSPNGNIEAFKEYYYNEDGTINSTLAYHTGEQYSLEPGVFARTASSYIKSVFKYEFYSD